MSCAGTCSTGSGRVSYPGASPSSATMDEVYGLLVTMDYPDAVSGGLRRTTDALRAVLERTRGEI